MIYSDKPISTNKDDYLGRGGFAKLLAQSLLDMNNGDTFSIGLFGKWGCGKTSLVNMTLNEVDELQKNSREKNKLIVVHFEPWNFSNTDQLLSQFFIHLSNKFRSNGDKKLAKIGNALEKYSDAFEVFEVIPTFGKSLALFGKKCVSKLGKKLKKGADEKDILKQKEYVISLLEKQSNKILIVIDDIDRLNNEQIRQVFQLITSVAKFPNTIYLLVFDKEIVVKALEKVQEGSGEDYLEKIIQMPIQIPDIQQPKLRGVLFSRMDMLISEHKDICFQEEHWQRLFYSCVEPFVKSIRDINRLCNSVKFKLTTLFSEVDFTDMVAISALEIHFPAVYEWVKGNKPILTGEQDWSAFKANLKTQKDCYEFYQSQIKSLLEDSTTKYEDTNHVVVIITFLSQMFPYFGQKIGKLHETYDLNVLRMNNQIAHPDKFDRYFDLELDNIFLKKAEVLNAVNTFNQEEFMTFLLELDKKEISYDFLEEVNAMLPKISADRARTISRALIVTTAQLNTNSQKRLLFRINNYAEFLVIDLIDRINSTERIAFISDIINNADLATLQSIANIINRIELGYGRLAANGKEYEYKKIISLEELLQLEILFINKVKEMLRLHNLFNISNWRMIYYLLESFDLDYAHGYLADALNNDGNILRYLDNSVNVWSGGDTRYEFNQEYKKHLTEERILQAIKSQKESGELFLMSEKTQNICGAFYLNALGKQDYKCNLSQADVDKLLATWKSENEKS
ncbi:MAG: P-loop NTPase fold protein [Oscillospiraceae bacterium]|nr:P-loop NTPase fold protein [Oscillospiraceae bacterium]